MPTTSVETFAKILANIFSKIKKCGISFRCLQQKATSKCKTMGQFLLKILWLHENVIGFCEKGIFVSTIQYLPEDAGSSWLSSLYPQGSGQTEARGWWGLALGRRGCRARRGGTRGRPAGGRSAHRGQRASGGRGMCWVCSTGSGTPGREEPGGIELRIKILVNILIMKGIRVHSHAPSIRSHRGKKWFDQISSQWESKNRRTDLHSSLSEKSSFYLPAFEFSRSCRSASGATEAVRHEHEQVISDAGWSKLDFVERDKCRPALLRLSLARNVGEKPVMSLYVTDRMEGARLPPW